MMFAHIKVHDKEFGVYLSEETLQARIKEMAETINKEYAGKRVIFLSILNGAFMFAADFFKHLTIDAEICFIKLASYKGMKSTGAVYTAIGLDANIHNQDIVILEDIVDTGKTLHYFLPTLHDHHPKSIALVTLLHKAEMTTYDVPIHITGFVIPNKFVIGYGLDYDGLGRNYKEIYAPIEEV